MYNWDLFISYPRAGHITRWVKDVLAPQLRDELGAHGIEAEQVFLDTEALDRGDWPTHLREAHRSSKVFLAVLAVPYFRKGWCMSEWSRAFEREQRCWGPQHRQELVIPVEFNDCQEAELARLPSPLQEQVRARSRVDLRRFSSLAHPREQVADAYYFRQAMQELCTRRILPAIRGCPEFDPDWPALPVEPIPSSDRSWFPGRTT